MSETLGATKVAWGGHVALVSMRRTGGRRNGPPRRPKSRPPAVIGALLALALAGCLSVSNGAADHHGADTRLGFVIGNGNDGVQNVFEGTWYGLDDFHTNNLFFRLLVERPRVLWSVHLEQEMLTDRAAGNRTDFLRVGLGAMVSNPAWQIEMGLGVFGRGNYGGQSFQNWLHEALGQGTFDLQYPADNLGGAYLQFGAAKPLVTARRLLLAGHFDGLLSTKAGPSHAAAALGLHYNRNSVGDGSCLKLGLKAGYRLNHVPDAEMEPFYGPGGPTLTLYATVARVGRFGVCLYAMTDPYAIGQEQFGFQFYFGAAARGAALAGPLTAASQ